MPPSPQKTGTNNVADLLSCRVRRLDIIPSINRWKMPRRSSSGRSAPRPAARSSSHVPAKTASSAPPPAPVQRGSVGSILGDIGAAVADGIAWGTGNAMAHRAMDYLFGPRVIQHEIVDASAPAAAASSARSVGSDACGGQSKAFQECLNNSGSDISKCQFYMDMLQECHRSSGAALRA